MRYLTISILFLLCHLSFSQTEDEVTFLRYLFDAETNTPIPFATINKTLQTDAKGQFNCNTKSIQGYHPEYGSFNSNSTNDTIFINSKNNLHKLYLSTYLSQFVINKAIAHKKTNTPKAFAPFTYNSYNKFYILTNQTEDTKNIINRLLSPFSFTLKHYSNHHNILLSESYTERIYRGPLKEEEIVKDSKVSGIDRPLLISLNSQVQTFSFYDSFIRIGTKNYVGPLAAGATKRYHFNIIDTLARDTDSLFTIQFYPKQRKYFESLRGYLFINSSDYALEKCIIYPAKEANNEIQITHSTKKINNGWFPEKTTTTIILEDVGRNKAQYTIVAESSVLNLTPNTSVKRKFSDIAVQYDETSFKDSTNWETIRPYQLTTKEQNTYTYFDTIGKVNNFTQAISVAEQLYFQKIPLKHLNIELKHLAQYNDYVGPQIGFGASSNDLLSKTFTIHGYTKYGFNDKEAKYGFGTCYSPRLKRNLQFDFNFYKDLIEAGIHPRFFYKNMYSTEWLRTLKLLHFEKTICTDLAISSNPINYLFIHSGVKFETASPTYNYSFGLDSITNYNLSTFYIGLKYAYGERFFKLLKERISLGRPFPVVWLEFRKNINAFANDFNYHQLYAKTEYKLNLVGLGTLGIQLSSGKTWGNLPYGKLYNGKGSLGVRTVAHNSFETMDYNEFLSSEFVYAFLSHDFGYLNFLNSKNFRPRLEFVYNLGWGKLNNPQEHNSIAFKTLEKGYLEMGTMINNLLVIKINPTKIGLGVGYIHRLGAYRYDTFGENSFFKLSLSIKG